MHHTAFTLVFTRGTDEEVPSNWNLRRPECFSHLIGLTFCKDIATLDNHHLAFFYIRLLKKTAALDRAHSFFNFGRKIREIELAIGHDFSSPRGRSGVQAEI